VDILVESGDRQELAACLERADIDSRRFYPPVHTQGPYADRGESYPVTREISENGLWLPSAPTLDDDDVNHICDRIREYFGE
jgi:perosamine synthetase